MAWQGSGKGCIGELGMGRGQYGRDGLGRYDETMGRGTVSRAECSEKDRANRIEGQSYSASVVVE